MNIFKKKEKTPKCSAVILAAGMSERMGTDKAVMKLGNLPVIVRTLRVFQNCPLVDDIIVVTRKDKILEVAGLCKEYELTNVSQVIIGGATRAESALAGVSAVREKAAYIAIHDGARPLVTEDVIERTLTAAVAYMAAVPVIPSTDTLKIVDGKDFITATVDRTNTVRVQTPQIFSAELIKGALTNAVQKGLTLTDDCSAIEMMGIKAKAVPGDSNNIKLTTPDNLIFAEAVLKDRSDAHAYRSGI